MPWTYHQSSARLLHNGVYVDSGYSGHGIGRDNPTMQSVPNIGPIPRGTYRIGAPFTHPHAGEYSMRLTPVNGTNTFGRDGFMIHGDSIKHPGQASNGCVIEVPLTRHKIWSSGDHILEVIQ
ncbi:DUF2778 domain-containing protein [Burkholderia sp. WAC0059]|uniref:tlde1 domain-containing protein n=1 Tax=Burkholderia sp. WAC0059 TaxID=2066022 RepID=UPI000C7F4CEB|nr:tlde1 domain-containing protein [Burkholderia sp. WAC0059]PLZ00607.1 DUF2778 domain-containing protein [Burkholderia sp. WAC0059]